MVSTKGRYALRMMIDLATQGSGEFISLKEICARQDISIKYLEQIVTLFTRAGLLKSVRGPQGGYKLSRKPEEYTVGEILRVAEGTLAPIACLREAPNQCERYNECVSVKFWEGFYGVVTDYTENVTLSDVVKNNGVISFDGAKKLRMG